MSKSINRVFLLGHVGADPVVRHTRSGEAIVQVRLATTRRWRNKTTGALEEKTQWHRLVFFKKNAATAADYLVKGTQLHVEGQLEYRAYLDKAQQKRWQTQVLVAGFVLLQRPQTAVGEDTHDEIDEIPLDEDIDSLLDDDDFS